MFTNLECLVACPAYPNEVQLGAILGQLLDGLSYIESEKVKCETLVGSQQLPDDTHRIYRRLLDVANYGEGIYPPEVKGRILASLGSRTRPPPDNFWAACHTQTGSHIRTGHATEEGVSPAIDHFLQAEMDGLERIEHTARTSLDTGRSESAWDAFLHIPLLQLALRGYHYRDHALQPSKCGPALELCTTARIVPQFAPGAAQGPTGRGPDWAASKMVDIVLGLRLDSSLPDDPTHSTAPSAPDIQGHAGSTPNFDAQLPPKLDDDNMRKLHKAIRTVVALQVQQDGTVWGC
ncbi:Uu.00g136350.m01.CDS01 [Anthostomella pinea]|uniref:Uu.00g136350.m01.CDS01 n=1 Tax=Anthostomella pinea TaxID=933095 RepID=A0AAI8VPD2_9PEZI|nr:Uu.00g136350.m01.CDS01 [Anthostomella pinea]